MPTYPSIHRSIHLSIHPSMLLRVNFPNFPVPSSLTLGDAMHQGASGGSHDASAMVRCGAG